MIPNGTNSVARPDSGPLIGNPGRLRAMRSSDPSRMGGGAPRRSAKRLLGFMGVAAALPFFVWLPLGWLGAVPTIVDVFGMTGLRIPAGFTVGGLLLAAIGFHEVGTLRRPARSGTAGQTTTLIQSRRQD